MSDSAAPLFPVPVEQALIDSLLGTTLVQCLLTGIYVLIFIQAIVPLIREGKRKTYAGVLILLFLMVTINLATSWQILRDIVVTNDQTRDTMTLELLAGPLAVPQAANATGCIAVFIADALLVWRCYVLWQRNKFLLAGFTLLLLGEVALIPILLVLNASVGPGKVSIVCIFFFISIGITVIATALIIYRIFDVSKRSNGQARTRYQYTIEILIESGIMYSSTLLIAGVILAVRGDDLANLPMTQAASYWGGILTPITGIAPTLISSRIVSGKARDEKQWSQPVSVSLFKARGTTVGSTTVHVTTATKSFGAGSVTPQGDIGLGSRKISNDSETQLSFGLNDNRSGWQKEKTFASAV